MLSCVSGGSRDAEVCDWGAVEMLSCVSGGSRDAELCWARPNPGAGRQQRAELWLLCPAGSSPEAKRYDRLRECIRQFFPQRRCFVFDQPASKRDLLRLEELLDDRMDPEFLQQLEKFCSYIWEQSPPKSIPGGCKMTGESE